MSSSSLCARVRAGVSLFATALIGVACEQAVDADAPPISRIEVDPAQASVPAGRTATLTARVFGATGEDLGPMPVFWSTQNPQVATVNQAGVVTGVGPGATQIAASLNGRSGIAAITVTARPVVVVRVSPSESDVSTGRTLQLSAEALDGDGAAIVGRTTTWSSSNSAVATVDGAGLVSGVSAGTATVRATIDGVQGSSLVRVVPIAVTQMRITPNTANIAQGDVVQLTGTPLDAQGNPLTGRLIVWSSSNQSVAVVSNTGHVQSVSAGSATITATCEGVSATATITVAPVPVASVTIVPATPSVVLGQTAALSATVRDAQGNVLNGRTVTWSSSAPAVATITGSGVITGVSLGTTTITATSGGVDGTTIATVSAVPVAFVDVNPASANLVVGGTFQLLVTARDAQGNVLTGRTATWSSSNVNVATVNSSGLVTGITVGAATVTANIGGVTGTATISVGAVPVATITVAPNPASVEEKKTLQLTPTLYDANGNVLTGRTIVWSSSDNSVAAISQSGLITAIAPGLATITVSASGSSAATPVPVTVTYAPVASVGVAPSTATVQVGGTTTFNATLLDAGGQPLSFSGRTVAWSSSDPSKATVNASTGVATGIASGATTIVASASSPGQATAATGSATLSVTVAAVTSVIVLPGSATVHAGGAYSRSFTAEARDGSGNLVLGRPVVWTSSNQGVATVDPTTGLVTGVTPGSATITATIDGVPGTASVTVDLVAVSSVSVSPPTASITVPATQQLTASPLDSASNAITGSALGGRTTSWASSNTGVASVSTSGLVTAVGAGNATITATIGGVNGTSAITVIGAVSTVAVSVVPDSVILPGTLPGVLTVTDAASQPLQGQTVALSSGPTSVATVAPTSGTTDAAGQFAFTVTGVGVNGNSNAFSTATITAVVGGVTGTKTVRVLRPVNTVTVSPNSPDINLGTSVTLTITARASSGAILPGRPCTITSSDTAIATVSAASVNSGGTVSVNSVAKGNATITVTCEGKSGTSSVTVK